jgi:hypothetical protein
MNMRAVPKKIENIGSEQVGADPLHVLRRLIGLILLSSVFYGSGSTAQASCAAGAKAPEFILEAKAVCVTLFEPGGTYSLWGNKVTKVLKFRGQRVRVDVLGTCSQTRQLSPTTGGASPVPSTPSLNPRVG